eukprot:jgi/Ulvmu1/4463/UM002_0188.1
MRQSIYCAFVLLLAFGVSFLAIQTWSGAIVKVLAVWLPFEGLFHVHRIYVFHKLNVTNHPLPEDDVQARLVQFKTLVGVIDMKEFLSGWFMNAPFDLLRRNEVLDFIAYGFWYRDRAQMSETEQQLVSDTLEDLEQAFSFQIPEGTNPDLQFMAHLWQPLRVFHKPLLVHTISEASVVLTHAVLLFIGFKRHNCSSFTYWTKHMGPPPHEPPLGKEDAPAVQIAAAGEPMLDPIGDALKMGGPGASLDQRRRDAEHWKRLHIAVMHTTTAAQSGVGYLVNAAGGGVGSLLDSHCSTATPASPGTIHAPDEGSAEAWSVWKKTYLGRWRAALLQAVGGVSLPFASEMRTLFGAEDGPAIVQTHGASPRTPGRSPRAASPHAPIKQRESESMEPIVFLHGVGFGLLPYLGFVHKLLRAFSGHPVIVLEVRHVSLRLCTQAKTVDELTKGIAQVMERHCVKAAHFVAHSFGTFVVAHTAHLYPDLIKSTLLCDPVCMLTCCPQLLHNFIYREPEGVLGLWKKPLDLFKRAVARDLIIAEAFCRRFWWHTLMLWPNELPPVTILSLSHQDELVPCELVQRQLQLDMRDEGGARENSGGVLEVVVSPGEHGAFVMKPSLQDRLLKQYEQAIRRVYQ